MKITRQMGRILCEARKKQGLTQRQLADKLGLTSSKIAMLESGRRGVPEENLKVLLPALDLTLLDLGISPEDRGYSAAQSKALLMEAVEVTQEDLHALLKVQESLQPMSLTVGIMLQFISARHEAKPGSTE